MGHGTVVVFYEIGMTVGGIGAVQRVVDVSIMEYQNVKAQDLRMAV